MIGSMARTVEQMQLSVEGPDELQGASGKRPAISRITFLSNAASCVEAEQRRRIFWSVFLMDRFCSVATRYVALRNLVALQLSD